MFSLKNVKIPKEHQVETEAAHKAHNLLATRNQLFRKLLAVELILRMFKWN